MAKDTAVQDIADALGGTVVDTDTGEITEGQKVNRLVETRGVTSISDALAAIHAHGVEAEKASEYEVLDDKDGLIGKEFVGVQWRFNDSEQFGGQFVSMEVVDASGNKFVINDGSTGIYAQVKHLTEQRIAQGWSPERAHIGLHANAGLRASSYTREDGIKGKTHYIQGLFTPPVKK